MLCFDVCLVKNITVLLSLPNIQTVQTRSFKLSAVARCRCAGNVKFVWVTDLYYACDYCVIAFQPFFVRLRMAHASTPTDKTLVYQSLSVIVLSIIFLFVIVNAAMSYCAFSVPRMWSYIYRRWELQLITQGWHWQRVQLAVQHCEWMRPEPWMRRCCRAASTTES